MSHVATKGSYVAVFAALIVLTLVTVAVTYVDLGALNLAVAMAIAITKATLVVLFFMHARYSERLVQVTIVTALLFLAVLAVFSFGDYLTRGMLGVSGR
jgi:cytochrome c oxidase subunit 4